MIRLIGYLRDVMIYRLVCQTGPTVLLRAFSNVLLILLSDEEFSTEPIVADLKIKSDAIIAALLKTPSHAWAIPHWHTLPGG